MALVAWAAVAVTTIALAAAAGWLMTTLKGGRTPMDTVDRETVSNRFWRSPF